MSEKLAPLRGTQGLTALLARPQEAAVKGLAGKVPKGVAACVAVLLQAVRCAAACARRRPAADPAARPSAFGVRVVKPQPLLRAAGPLFDHKDAAVRDTAKALAVELTRWLGAGAVKRDLTDKMRDAAKKGVRSLRGLCGKGKGLTEGAGGGRFGGCGGWPTACPFPPSPQGCPLSRRRPVSDRLGAGGASYPPALPALDVLGGHMLTYAIRRARLAVSAPRRRRGGLMCGTCWSRRTF